MLKYSGGVSTVQTFQFTGNIVGQPLTELEISPITSVCVAGDGESWYQGVREIASNILIGYTNLTRDLNRYRNRITYIPAGVGNSLRQSLAEEGRSFNLATLKLEIESQINPVIALEGDEQPRREVRIPWSSRLPSRT